MTVSSYRRWPPHYRAQP